MGRLIDADALLRRFSFGEAESETDTAWIAGVRKMIREQPTAYDVDKVSQELERMKNPLSCPPKYVYIPCERGDTCEICKMQYAIDVVKKGGEG